MALEGNLTIKGIPLPVILRTTHFKQGLDMMKRQEIGAAAPAG